MFQIKKKIQWQKFIKKIELQYYHIFNNEHIKTMYTGFY